MAKNRDNDVVNDRHANVNRPKPVKRERLIREEYKRNDVDNKRNKRLKEYPVKREESGQVTKNCAPHENNSDDDTSTDVEILELDEIVKRGISGLFFPSTTVKKEMKEKEQDGECNAPDVNNSDDDVSTEVEILDSDEIFNQGTTSVFVPSTIYRNDLDVPTENSDYRERVLNVLNKPFDKAEYRTLSDKVKVYLPKYPGLEKKLAENRYKKTTRLTIFRGFFYWLQNVMHDGAFKPWEDSQCLAVAIVLPGSEQKN